MNLDGTEYDLGFDDLFVWVATFLDNLFHSGFSTGLRTRPFNMSYQDEWSSAVGFNSSGWAFILCSRYTHADIKSLKGVLGSTIALIACKLIFRQVIPELAATFHFLITGCVSIDIKTFRRAPNTQSVPRTPAVTLLVTQTSFRFNFRSSDANEWEFGINALHPGLVVTDSYLYTCTNK